MILEIVRWDVKPKQEKAFESAFSKAQEILSNSFGYKSHQLQKCVEKPNRYILMVEWERIEDHTIGFQKSVEYQRYRAMLKQYYEPGTTIEHYEMIHKKLENKTHMNSIDNQTKYWDKVANNKTFTHPINIEKFKQFVSPNSSILDFGCGYGRICHEIFNLGYLNIIGIDSSRKMVERGKKEYPHINLNHFQGSKLPFDSNKFDTITLFAVLTCIPTNNGQKMLVDELFRVLKPNGILYVSDYLLQDNIRNLDRYKKFQLKYGQYGVFELPEGAVVRHHSTDWINSLFTSFKKLHKIDCEFKSMNGNKSLCFQMFMLKPE